ncbi:MAG: FtsX-like permease family protein [Lachnospiraceae bacterium]|nr:FtsX-like permease family protein [Lachnospiraceae bacterium]
MLKVMIDRSAFGISLIKIFGYRAKEIRKLYLNGNLFIVVIGAFISIPLAKKVMDVLYPYMVSNVACGMNLTFSMKLYGIIFGAVILLYFIINPLLVHRVKKIVPAEVLKNRE